VPHPPHEKEVLAWGVLWRSKNVLDGERIYLQGTPDHPSRTLLFYTRREARAHVAERYGYIRHRPDLRREPHGWRMPVVVRVTVKTMTVNFTP
jgi:hypothetical protein